MVSVVMGFRDWRIEHLKLAVRSHRSSTVDAEVIVVDYGSTDPVPVRRAVETEGGRVIRSDVDGRWNRAAALNIGIRAAQHEQIVTTDADIVFGPRTLETVLATLADAHDATGAYGLVQCRNLPEDLSVDRLQNLPWDLMERACTLRQRWGMGGCACFSQSFINQVRGYDERLEWWGAEDNDLCRRAEQFGLTVRWVDHPQALIYHVWHPSIREVNRDNPAFERTLARNRTIARTGRPVYRNLTTWGGRASVPPPVSVVIVRRHQAAVFRRAIDSVLHQTFENFELIVADDGCEDDTRAIVESLDDPRLRYVRQTAGEARGRLVVEFTDDEVMAPTHLERLVAANGTHAAGTLDIERDRIRAFINTVLPSTARVLVISKGDDDLLRLDGRQASHFPQDENGGYAWHHPAASDDAIAELETHRSKGAEYLLIPAASFWWLTFYEEFARHLATTCRRVSHQSAACVLYNLQQPPSVEPLDRETRAGSRRATLSADFLAPAMLIDPAAAAGDVLPLSDKAHVVELDVTSCCEVNVGARIVPKRAAIRGDAGQVEISYLDASGHAIVGDYPDLEGSADTGYRKSLPLARTFQFITFRLFPPPDATRMQLAFRASPSNPSATIGNSVLVAAQRRGLSVVVPVHREEERIGRLLRSLGEQTLGREHFEVIFVINGPSDGSATIIDAWAQGHPDLRVQQCAIDVPSAGHARNAGIARARYSHVTFVDADESLPSDHLAGMVGESLPTFYCRQTPFIGDLKSGEDVCFYADLYSRFPGLFRPTVRRDSVSNREPSGEYSVRQPLEVITHLNRFLKRQMPADVRALIESEIDAQSDRMAEYLHHARSEYAAFATLVTRRKLSSFPWARVNTTVANRIVFSYCFPPARDASGISMAKRIVALNEPCDVICSDMSTVRSSDPTVYDLVTSHIGLIEHLPTSGGFADWKQIAKFAEMAAEKGAVFEQKKKAPYSRMYSRAQWPASHFAAALFKVRRPNIEWTAEFSDPLLIDKYGQARQDSCDMSWLAEHRILDAIREQGFAADPAETRLFYWCEMLPYTLADRIVFINESQLTYMLSYCRDDMVRRAVREKAEISQHPVPHVWAKSGNRTCHLDDECANLAYFGSVYANRSLSVVFEAIAALSGEERQRLRLYVFTRQIAETQEEVDACRLWDVVFVLPEMDYLEFLRSLDDFDALVVTDVDRESAAGANPYLPSKLSDYATSKTPILAIYERGSELSKRPEPTYWCEIQQSDTFLSRMVQVIREILSSKLAKTAPQ